MPYVQRDDSGNIIGAFANLQRDYATEFLANTDPAVVAFLNPPPTADQVRIAAIQTQPDYADIFNRLRTSTAAQIDAWLTANVTTLAQARAVLAAIVKYLATKE